MINKINLPYHKLLFGLIITFVPLYFKIPYFAIIFVIFSSYLISISGNIKKAIIFYLILTFMLPYDFIHLSTGSSIGLIFNEYFIAGLPLYFLFPKMISNKHITYNIKFSYRIIFILTFIILLYSNIIPAIEYVIGLGGHKVRLIFLFNFINSLLLFYFFTKIVIDKYFIVLLTKYFILLGFLLALSGIIQYIIKIPVVPNDPNTDFSRLYIISNTNPVDCVPYLLVPFVFSLSTLMNSKKISLKLLIAFSTILFALVLTWSRWAIITIIVIVISSIILNRRMIKRTALIIFVMILVSPIIIISVNNILQSDQKERLGESNNLFARTYLMGLGVTAILQKPILGYGFGNTVEAMFNQESQFNPFEENSNNSVETYANQSVHQFILEYIMSLGILYIIPLFFMYTVIVKRSLILSKICIIEIKFFYVAIFLSTIALFIFWLQNVGSQMFYLYAFWGLISSNIKENMFLGSQTISVPKVKLQS